MVFGSSLLHHLKIKPKTRCQRWTPSGKTFWIRAFNTIIRAVLYETIVQAALSQSVSFVSHEFEFDSIPSLLYPCSTWDRLGSTMTRNDINCWWDVHHNTAETHLENNWIVFIHRKGKKIFSQIFFIPWRLSKLDYNLCFDMIEAFVI